MHVLHDLDWRIDSSFQILKISHMNPSHVLSPSISLHTSKQKKASAISSEDCWREEILMSMLRGLFLLAKHYLLYMGSKFFMHELPKYFGICIQFLKTSRNFWKSFWGRCHHTHKIPAKYFLLYFLQREDFLQKEEPVTSPLQSYNRFRKHHTGIDGTKSDVSW